MAQRVLVLLSLVLSWALVACGAPTDSELIAGGEAGSGPGSGSSPGQKPPNAFSTFPKERWQRYQSVDQAGFDAQRLATAESYANAIGSDAVLIVHRGAVVANWGDTERRFWCHSSRKSLVAMLAGIYEARGQLDLERTLEELKIDDQPSLLPVEKTARVSELLKVRSGIYIASAADPTPPLLERGSRTPGEVWFYNNWDFNVMGLIVEQTSGVSLFEGFQRELADPLQLEHFERFHGHYFVDTRPETSIHPAQLFRLSARDMARIGLLVQNRGTWNGKVVIPSAWVDDMTFPHSKTRFWYETLLDFYPPSATNTATLYQDAEYGYMWWLFDNPKTITAAGNGGQTINVLPDHELVVVHRSNTFAGEKVTMDDHHTLLAKIAAARIGPPDDSPDLAPLENQPLPYTPYALSVAELQRFEGNYALAEKVLKIRLTVGELRVAQDGLGEYALRPTGKLDFFIEDINAPATFVEGDDDAIAGVFFQNSGSFYKAVGKPGG